MPRSRYCPIEQVGREESTKVVTLNITDMGDGCGSQPQHVALLTREATRVDYLEGELRVAEAVSQIERGIRAQLLAGLVGLRIQTS